MKDKELSILNDLKELADNNAADTLTEFFLYILTYEEIRQGIYKELMRDIFNTLHLLKDARELLKENE